MPKRDNVILECDFCGNYDTIDVRDPADKVMPIIGKWRGVMDGDQPPGQADSHRWYDSLDCLTLGEKRHAEKKQEDAAKQAEQDRVLARAQEQLKNSPYMTDRAVTVGKA